MNQDKGKACRLTNCAPNPVMHDFELAMGDRDSGKQGFFLFWRKMGKLVWVHYG
jgi:hypothetical protein